MSRWKKFLHISKESLEVAIISCGDTGMEIGIGIIKNLQVHDVKVKSLLITTELVDEKSQKNFELTVSIPGSKDGYAKRLDVATKDIKNSSDEIKEKLEKLLGKSFEGLLFVATGSGGTGLGATTVVLEILAKEFNLKPPVITLLPEVFENSRVQYNAAEFIYQIAFKKRAPKNPIIILDNKPRIRELDLPFSEVSKKRLEIIPTALADLLIASFKDSITEEFDANVSDLFDVIHSQGISVFVSETIGGESGDLDNLRIEDVISESVIDTTSLNKDAVFEAERAFISIFNLEQPGGKLDFATRFETNKLFKEFRNTRPHVKFVSDETGEAKLRAIIAGLPLPTRILQIMRIARDSRKRIIVEENMLDYTEIRIDEDEIFQLEDSLQAVFDPYEEELPPKIKVSVKKESKSEKSKKNASTKNAD
ncbi:MAG: Tubulin-like protein CetZ [Candidatus Heimdallarchaeota archaeon LC_2]|nr:MAG: Tubulin-like protein CetZ [Candidatus Heimdallarchaeota archaeon LC_2]